MTEIAQRTIDTSPEARECVRRCAGESGTTCPIRVVPGRGAPRMAGSGPYHTTLSGKTVVHHPNAYKWRTLYHPSTLRIEVGAEWVRRHCPVPHAEAS